MPYFPEKISIAQHEVLGNWDLYESVVRDPKNLSRFSLHKKIMAAGQMKVHAVGVPKNILLGQRKNHVSRHPELERYHLELGIPLKKTIILSVKFNHRLNDEERTALSDVCQLLIKDKRTFLFYPQQTSWIFLLNSSWKSGAHAAMNELFELNPEKGSTSITFKAFRRISSIILSTTGFITGFDKYKGILITKEDLVQYYNGDMDKVEMMMLATDGFNPISPRMMQDMVGRKLFKPLMGGKTWRMLIKRFLPRPLDNWSGKLVHGYMKGNVMALPQLEESSIDYVIYEWNLVTDILPKWEIELARFSTIIHATRTRFDWQTVMNGGIWGLYSYAVRRRGESVKDIISAGAESIRNEYKLQCEAYDDGVLDDLENFDEEDEEYESYGDVLAVFKKLEDPLEFTDIRSKVINMLFNGPAYKYKAQNFSITIPENWAKLRYERPDVSGMNRYGMIDFERCQLKSGQIYCAGDEGPAIAVRRPNASANEWIGIRPEQPVEMVSCDFYKEDKESVYFNVFDLKVWMPQAGGFDHDDPFIVWTLKYIVNRMKKNVWFPPKSKLDESFKTSFLSIPEPDSDKAHNWERFGMTILERFRTNTLPGIGLYAYCLGCLHLLVRYGEFMLAKNRSFRRKALPWSSDMSKNPEDRWAYFDLDKDWRFLGVGSDGKKIFKTSKEIITEVLKRKEVFLWALEHIEAVIDAANGKPKYTKDPDAPGHYLPSLDAYKLVRYLSTGLFSRFPGPDGRFIKSGIRIHTFMDDAVSGISGCEYKCSDGKKKPEPMMFGVWEEGFGRVIPAVLKRVGGFTSKKEEALKSTGLIFHKHISGGENQDFIQGEFTEFMRKVDSENLWYDFFEAYWAEVYGNPDFKRWENTEPWHYGYVGEPSNNWMCKLLDASRTSGWSPEAKLEEFIRVSMIEGAYHIEKRMKQYALLKLFRAKQERRIIHTSPSKEMRSAVRDILIKWFMTNSKDTILRHKSEDKFHPKVTVVEYDKLVEVLKKNGKTIDSVYAPSERIGWMGNLVWYDQDGNRHLIEITKHFLAWLIAKEREEME